MVYIRRTGPNEQSMADELTDASQSLIGIHSLRTHYKRMDIRRNQTRSPQSASLSTLGPEA
jgi:hypothetical protein